MTPRGVLAFCREKEVKAIDLRFANLFGTWQHVTVPVSRLSEASFEQGFAIEASNNGGALCDRLIVPQASSAFLDPFASIPTLVLIGSIQDPITREDDLYDSRIIAERSINFLQGTGIADQARISATCEFYLFNDVQISMTPWSSAVRIHPNAVSPKSEFPAAISQPGLNENDSKHRGPFPIDSSFDFRNSVMELLIDADISVAQHFQMDHATGQAGLVLDNSNLVAAADSLMFTKYMIRSAAKQNGKLATFLPKPIENLRGSGMPLDFSLWRGDEPLFGGQAAGGLSELAMLSIGGILHHASALAAICNPTTNSFRRLMHSIEPAFYLGYSHQSRRAACRIPSYSSDPRTKCIEFCTPDASANPYLAFAAILMAAIDGIQNKIDPGSPMTNEAGRVPATHTLPRSLWEALDCLEQDSDFLLRGGVFSQDMLVHWLDYKRNIERAEVESYPTPAEFQRYFDC